MMMATQPFLQNSKPDALIYVAQDLIIILKIENPLINFNGFFHQLPSTN